MRLIDTMPEAVQLGGLTYDLVPLGAPERRAVQMFLDGTPGAPKLGTEEADLLLGSDEEAVALVLTLGGRSFHPQIDQAGWLVILATATVDEIAYLLDVTSEWTSRPKRLTGDEFADLTHRARERTRRRQANPVGRAIHSRQLDSHTRQEV